MADFTLLAVQSVRVIGSLASVKKNPHALAEAISVGVVIRNPLDIQLNLNDLQLAVAIQRQGQAAPMHCSPVSLSLGLFDKKLQELCDSRQLNLDTHDELIIDSRPAVLEPREELEIILRVCPLVICRLTILGLKWRLNDAVWNSHTFALSGELLHDSLEHRASGARAPDTSLTFDICGSMPWLSLHVSGLPDSVLQGEVVSGSLTIKNCGQAGASNIFLKANVPWLYVGAEPLDGNSSALLGALPTASLLGSSGTVICVGRDGVVLGAGAEVNLPVRLRGVGGGKQTLKFLLQYSPEDSTGQATPHTIRYVRHAWEVCVLPSLHMFATVTQLANAPGEYVLSILLTNFCSDNGDTEGCSISIHDVCCLSDTWSIEPLNSLPRASAADRTIVVHNQESITLCYQVRRFGHKQAIVSNWGPAATVAQGNKPRSPALNSALSYLCVDDMVATHQQHCDVLRKSREAAQSAQSGPRGISSVRRDRAAEVSSTGDDQNVKHNPSSLEALCARHPSDLSLLVTWGAARLQNLSGSSVALPVNGYHQIVPVSVSPSQSHTNACPVSVDITQPSMAMHHDFVAHPVCQIPLTVRVTNLVLPEEGEPIDFEVEVIQDSWESCDELALTWIGALKRTIRSLEPAGSVDVALCACVPGPGRYDLNHFSVRLLFNGRHFSFPVHRAVSVESI